MGLRRGLQQVEQSRGQYWWNGLDAAIGNGNMARANSMIVLGSTPTWAASDKKAGTYPNKGAASMPKNIADWKSWVTAVATRYKGSVGAYQIWNEANLTNYWAGTPKQMATLTKEAYRIIKSIDPSAKVIAASSTVRLTARYNAFFPKYLTALKKQGWPIDAVAVHTYPAGNEGPAARVKYIQKTQADMRKAGVPADRELLGHRGQLRHPGDPAASRAARSAAPMRPPMSPRPTSTTSASGWPARTGTSGTRPMAVSASS